MTPQELKNSILQLAIQGKLVEQRAEEGTGAELLEKILAERYGTNGTRGTNGTAKTNGTKRRASSVSKVSSVSDVLNVSGVPSDEKPFEIPESWEWVRLGEVVFNHGQKKPTEDFSYVDIGSIDNKHQRLSDAENIVKPEKASPRARKIIQRGDILYSTVRPYLHNICIVDREFSREPIASTGFAVMACSDCLDNKFLFYFLLSPDFDRYANSTENAKGVAYPAISDKRLYNALLPLPPLAEQKRIVAKIEELMPLVDRYEKAWSRLEDFNKRFPVDMQKSLLQMAIQGKLVEQRADEGTGAELLEKILAERYETNGTRGTNGTAKTNGTKRRASSVSKVSSVSDVLNVSGVPSDEKPFEIPESWEWVRLGEICRSISDGDHQPPPQVERGIPFLVISNVSSGTIDFTNTRHVPESYYMSLSGDRIAEKDDILFTVTGSYGIPVQVETTRKFCFQRHIALLKPLIDRSYLIQALKSPAVKLQCDAEATGTAQKTVGLKALRTLLIPLPPLAEQKRIVAKLEELLPLCERLKSESNSAANS